MPSTAYNDGFTEGVNWERQRILDGATLPRETYSDIANARDAARVSERNPQVDAINRIADAIVGRQGAPTPPFAEPGDGATVSETSRDDRAYQEGWSQGYAARCNEELNPVYAGNGLDDAAEALDDAVAAVEEIQDVELRKFAIKQAGRHQYGDLIKTAEKIYEFLTTPELATLERAEITDVVTTASGKVFVRVA